MQDKQAAGVRAADVDNTSSIMHGASVMIELVAT